MALPRLAVGGAYRQRNPKATPLYKIVERYFAEFRSVYPERFQEKYGYWRAVIDWDTWRQMLNHLTLA